jgi:hypothetical protein
MIRIDVGGVADLPVVIDGTDPNCVPWNPFVPGGVTQDQLGYLQAAGLQIGRINQEIYNGIITGTSGLRHQAAVGFRRHPARVRLRVSSRHAR